MKKLHLHLLIIFSVSFLFASCKKDDEAAPPSKMDFLANNRVWRLTEHTVNPGRQDQNGQIVTNLYQYFGSTYQDNIIKFNRNPNSYTFEEGTTKGDPTDDQVSDLGTWMLNSDETVLVLHSANGEIFSFGQVFTTQDEQVFIINQGQASHLTNLNIVELTATTLRYSYSYRVQQNGPVYTETLTYTPQ